MTLNPLPLLGALVLEAAYLLFVPDSKWFEKRLERRYDEEIIARREKQKAEVLPQVRYEIQQRFSRLEEIRKQIEGQSKGEDKWFREALRKLDFLLEKYLQFALSQSLYCQYLASTLFDVERGIAPEPPPRVKKKRPQFDIRDEEVVQPAKRIDPTEKWVSSTVQRIQEHYRMEIEEIDHKLTSDPDFPTRQVEEKRKEVLTRRHDRVVQQGLILHNLAGQMQLMADTFGLINDEIRTRSPEQVLQDIDEVVLASNSLTEAIEAVTPYEELVSRLGPTDALY